MLRFERIILRFATLTNLPVQIDYIYPSKLPTPVLVAGVHSHVPGINNNNNQIDYQVQ